MEQMQRLLRSQVLEAVGAEVDEAVLAKVEAALLYNAYIALLEDLRQHLNDAPFSYYRMLLAAPLPERALLMRRSAIMLDDVARQSFRMALLKATLGLSRP